MSPLVGGLSALAADYDALFCDVWGVLHNGVRVFPEAAHALQMWRRERGPVVLVTNSPRPSASAHAQLAQLGCPRDAYDDVASSGEATRAELSKRRDQSAFHLGPDRDKPLFHGLELEFASFEHADFLACTGLFDDETETPDDYRVMLEAAAARNMFMVCANPDLAARRGDKIIPCAGALAALYEEMGGSVARAGKPFGPIYDVAFGVLSAAGRPEIRVERVLAVGDGPETDLEGARRQRIDAVYVADGLFGHDVDAADAAEWLQERGQRPKAVMRRLVW